MIPSREWSILSGLSGDALVPWNRSMPPEVSPSPVSTPAAERIGHGFAWLVTLAWTLLIGAAASVNYANPEWDAIQHARSVADAYIDKDLAVHATRPIEGDFAVVHGIQSHLTSLVLKNPNNTPTAWERSALERLAAGSPNVVESDTSSDREYLRLMRPVYMEQSCMKCHSDMNIPVGGLRGGITASVPMAPYRTEHQRGLTRAMLSHLGLWFIGLLGIAFTTLAGTKSVRANERGR
jgi:hypothetical protein